MTIETLGTIKNWFKTGSKPTQAQFWSTWDSFWHKEEKIPINAIENIETILSEKSSVEALENHLTDASAHAELFEQKVDAAVFDDHLIDINAHAALFSEKENKKNKGVADGYAPLNEFVKITHEYLNIVNDLVTGGENVLLSAEQGKVLQKQIKNINILLASDNVNLDNVQELVDAIETIQMSLSAILVNDLTTGGITKALTAEMGKVLKGLIDALSINKVDKEEGSRLISSSEIDKLASLRNTETLEGTYAEIKVLKDASELIANTRYIITDYQTKYFIDGSNSSGIAKSKKISANISGWAVLDDDSAFDMYNGLVVTITELPVGYTGALQVGNTTTVSTNSGLYYFKFANGMQSVVGLKLKYSLIRYQTISQDTVINDSNGKVVMKPGGVINTEVHDGSAYMDQTAIENMAVPIERLVLVSSTSNQFQAQGYSDTFAGDIIEYDFDDVAVINDNLEVIGTRKGFITKRSNDALSIDVPIDWRVTRFRRWLLSSASRTAFINQDLDPATTRVGYQSKFLFTANNRTGTHTLPFYLAKLPEGKFKNIDDKAMVKDFSYSANSNISAKDFNIFTLDHNRMPIDVEQFKVSHFKNTVFQAFTGEFSRKLNVVMRDSYLYGNTFVSHGKILVNTTIIQDNTMLDTFAIDGSDSSIEESQMLSLIYFNGIVGSVINGCVFATQKGGLTGNSTPTPSVRWLILRNVIGSSLINSVFGQSTVEMHISMSRVSNSQIYVHYSPLSAEDLQRNRGHFYINGSIFTNVGLTIPRNVDKVGFTDAYFLNKNPLRTDGLFLYDYTAGPTLYSTQIKFNKYNYKLYYEDVDVNDVKTLVTFVAAKV
jgi:hypothetical protein